MTADILEHKCKSTPDFVSHEGGFLPMIWGNFLPQLRQKC